MSTSPQTESEPLVPESNHRESVADFVRWALAQLKLDFNEQNGILRLRLPEADRNAFGGTAELQLAMNDTGADAQAESIDLGSRFSKWLLERIKSKGPAVHVRPREQPIAVKDISNLLFAAYQVDGGQVHLGGCQLTDFPFLRLTFAPPEDSKDRSLRHLFVAFDGTSVSDEQARDLGLLEVEPITNLPPRLDESALNALVAAGRRMAAKESSTRDPLAATVDPLLLTLVWVKHASGQLQFTVGETTVQLPFSGWAKLIQPQPYIAKYSGASTFHLAATDDGRIDAFEEIATCEQSGRRVLRQDLVTCSVTGKHVLKEFTETCPVSGKSTLADQFVTCSVCRQRASKAVVQRRVCEACRNLKKIRKDDPRLVWILGEHTGLDRWKHWQLAETQNVYIARADSLMKRLLIVVDKESLAVHHLATSSRLAYHWNPVTGPARDEWLQ